MGLKN